VDLLAPRVWMARRGVLASLGGREIGERRRMFVGLLVSPVLSASRARWVSLLYIFCFIFLFLSCSRAWTERPNAR